MKRRTFVQTAGGSALGLLGAGLPLAVYRRRTATPSTRARRW